MPDRLTRMPEYHSCLMVWQSSILGAVGLKHCDNGFVYQQIITDQPRSGSQDNCVVCVSIQCCMWINWSAMDGLQILGVQQCTSLRDPGQNSQNKDNLTSQSPPTINFYLKGQRLNRRINFFEWSGHYRSTLHEPEFAL